jgi:hypothetical protein
MSMYTLRLNKQTGRVLWLLSGAFQCSRAEVIRRLVLREAASLGIDGEQRGPEQQANTDSALPVSCGKYPCEGTAEL